MNRHYIIYFTLLLELKSLNKYGGALRINSAIQMYYYSKYCFYMLSPRQ